MEIFNQNTRKYLRYEPPEEDRGKEEKFEPVVYFLREVREAENGKEGFVNIMNEEATLSREYIKYFVLGEWKLTEEKLLVRFEQKEDGRVES